MVTPPGNQENQPHAGADGAVRDVESGETDFRAAPAIQVEVNEIDHMPGPKPVDQIADNAAEDHPECGLAQEGAGVKMMAAEEQYHQRDKRDARQHLVVAAKQAPGRAGISPMNKPKEPIDNHLLLSVPEEPEHDLFGQLVERNHQQSDQRIAMVWRPHQEIRWFLVRDGVTLGHRLLKKQLESSVDLDDMFDSLCAPLIGI